MESAALAVVDGRIALRRASTTELVHLDQLRFAKSDGNYVTLAADGGSYRVRAPLRAFVERPECRLEQVHRRVAVCLHRVCRVVGGGGHRLLLILDSGEVIEVGRLFQAEIRRRLGASGSQR